MQLKFSVESWLVSSKHSQDVNVSIVYCKKQKENVIQLLGKINF